MASRGRHLTQGGFALQHSGGVLARLLAGGVEPLIDRIDRGIATGSLRAVLPDGSTRVLGGRAPGIEARITVHDYRCVLRLATGGSVGWYKAWELGEWESPDPVQIFALFAANAVTLGAAGRAKGPWRLAARALHALRRNTPSGSRANIAAHYDLGNDFYAAWLDETMTYSSALWAADAPDADLVGAQHAKMDRIADRLALSPGDRALEIGCGWGGTAAAMAARGIDVDAISLSDEQLSWARDHASGDARGGVNFEKRDYRDVAGTYDGIYSIEMVEALGHEYWPAFLDVVSRHLKPGGRAAIQFISMRDEVFDAYAGSADFIQTYVFPGGLLIRASEFRALAEARGLSWRDEERFGADYARTLAIWRERFDAAVADNRLPAGFDTRFVALWRYYLMYCEGGFAGGGIDVHQVTLVRED